MSIVNKKRKKYISTNKTKYKKKFEFVCFIETLILLIWNNEPLWANQRMRREEREREKKKMR